jgi:hypothetical protein
MRDLDAMLANPANLCPGRFGPIEAHEGGAFTTGPMIFAGRRLAEKSALVGLAG